MSSAFPLIISVLGLALLGITAVWLRRRTARSADGLPSSQGGTERQTVQRSEGRRVFLPAVITLVVFALALLTRWPHLRSNSGTESWFGVAQACAPALAAITFAIAVPLLVKRRVQEDRASDLTVRSPWDFGVGSWLLALATAVLVLALFLVATGMTATINPDCPAPVFSTVINGQPTTAGPYPGWVYGIPMVVSALLAFGATVLSVRHLAMARTAEAGSLRGITADVRRSLSRTIVLVTAAATTTMLCSSMWVAGSAVSRTAKGTAFNNPEKWSHASFIPGSASHVIFVQPTYAFGLIEKGVGVVFGAVALTLLLLAVRTVLRGERTSREARKTEHVSGS